MILGRRGYAVVGGKQGDPRLIRLGGWKWVALGVALLRADEPGVPALWRAAQRRVLAGRDAARHVRQLHACTTSISCSSSCPPPSSRSTTPSSSASLSATVGTHHRGGDRLPHGAPGDHRLARARLPRHRAGRDSRHRARRRPVPELHAPAVRALRHAVDPADRVRHASRCPPPISSCSRRSAPSIRTSRTRAASSARRGCRRSATSPRRCCAPA